MGNHTAEGSGTNKKVAKRNAAENMLEILGFKVPQSQPSKPALKSEEKVRPRALCPCSLTARCPSHRPGPSGSSGAELQGTAAPSPGCKAALLSRVSPAAPYPVLRGGRTSGLRAWRWVRSLLVQCLCGLGCFAGGQLALNQCVILSFVLLERGLHKRLINLRLLLILEQALVFLGHGDSMMSDPGPSHSLSLRFLFHYELNIK